MQRALVVFGIAAGCAHSRPMRVAYDRVELGHCGPRAQIAIVLGRACTLSIRTNGGAPRDLALPRADCDALFVAAAREPAIAAGSCTVPQPFMAGVTVTLTDRREQYACWNSALAGRMAALADRVAPDWQRGPERPNTCDFSDVKIEGELVHPD